MDYVRELVQWLQALPGDFAFLLALPFAVAAAGLWADRRRTRREEEARAKPEAPVARGGRAMPVPRGGRPAHS